MWFRLTDISIEMFPYGDKDGVTVYHKPTQTAATCYEFQGYKKNYEKAYKNLQEKLDSSDSGGK